MPPFGSKPLSRAKRYQHSTKFSKLQNFFSRPSPAPAPSPFSSSAQATASALTVDQKHFSTATLATTHNRPKAPNPPSLLFKPQPAKFFTTHTLTFKQALLSSNTMVRTSQFNAAAAKAKNFTENLKRPTSQHLRLNPPSNGWTGRCYRCLEVGHSRATCKAKLPKYAFCHREGHETSKCRLQEKNKRAEIDALPPQGHFGEAELPVTRPQQISVFVPQSKDSYKDARYLQRAVVVDARLWPAHDPAGIQARLMAVCGVFTPLELSTLDDEKYIAILPEGVARNQFLRDHASTLEYFSLVCYPWSPRIGSDPVIYHFKVWIDLYKVPLYAWNMDNLIPMMAQIGLILGHRPFEAVRSLNSLRVILAVKDLTKIPAAINFAVRGLETEIIVKVVGWDHHQTGINFPTDPTPPPSYFQEVQSRIFKQPVAAAQIDTATNMVPVDVDVLFQWFDNLQDDDQKCNMEKILRTSPLWVVKEKMDLLKAMKNGSSTRQEQSNPALTGIGPIKTTLRGSNSMRPTDHMVENTMVEKGGVEDTMQIQPPAMEQMGEKMILICGSPLLTLQSDPADINSVMKEGPTLNEGLAEDNTLNVANFYMKRAHLISHNQNKKDMDPVIQLKGKRPIDSEINSGPGKKIIERALDFSQFSPPAHTVSPLKTTNKTAPQFDENMLRRSGRQTKDNTKLKSFVVGNTTRKTRAPKLKPDVVKEALVAADLSRCLQTENVVRTPLTGEEQDKIKEFCGIIINKEPLTTVEEGEIVQERMEMQQTDASVVP